MKKLHAILLACMVVGGCPTLLAQTVNGIKAVVDVSPISFYKVETLTAPMADSLRREYSTQPEVYQKKLVEALNENLDQLVDRQLILRDFNTAGYSLPESLIDEIVQEYIREHYGDRATLTKTLQAEGITFEAFRRQQRDNFIIAQMRIKNISSEIIISPYKLERYYTNHQADFKVEDQVKLRMIVLNTPSEADVIQARQLAEEILLKIKEGATFSEMATIHSQGSQRTRGGEWGWVERSVLRKELADVAFSLKAGEMSGVIETPGALYLMLVEETKPAHVKPLNDVRDEIEQILLTQERARLQDEYIARLKKKTYVRFF
jgi:parvulin-like peptidyl-prolyl isomerase